MNKGMDTATEEVETLIHALRERPHIVEFAEKCAERADVCAHIAEYYAYYAAKDYAHYAADYATRAAYAVAYYAADEKGERELQLAHLRELHTREES